MSYKKPTLLPISEYATGSGRHVKSDHTLDILYMKKPRTWSVNMSLSISSEIR